MLEVILSNPRTMKGDGRKEGETRGYIAATKLIEKHYKQNSMDLCNNYYQWHIDCKQEEGKT